MANEFKLSKKLTLLLAATSGVAAANLYYAQPLLPDIAKAFHSGNSQVAMVITATQIGYALGLLFLLPLGDLVRRKPLIVGGIFAGSGALLLLSLASNLIEFEIMSLVVGLASVIAQVAVPLAADLANKRESGKAVGTVMSGLLIGILLARTFSGLIADQFGFSAVFVVAGVVMAIMGLVLMKSLPEVEAKTPEESVTSILKSTVSIFLSQRKLQWRAFYGMLSFAAFTILWTSLSFYLSGPPFHYSSGTIGLFGLFGVAGAMTARLTGSAVDRGWMKLTTLIGGILIIGSFLLMGFLGTHFLLLALGIVTLDAALQAIHITNQGIIYRLIPSARSRINSSYMTLYFIGGGIGSTLTGYSWQWGGWKLTTLIGASIGVIVLVMWAFDKTSMAKTSPQSPELISDTGDGSNRTTRTIVPRN
ncbi:MAG: MFS transporter [Actinobacteria bacterium]|nr:MFS transporter [Actinomycetota bacterium]